MIEPAINRGKEAVLASLFASSGEMGARIQDFNWSATPIGSIKTWSQSLRITLQILLSSRFPMQILWGSDYIQFYNDAYIVIAGNKHPTALGQRGEDCWKEVWDFSGPLLDRVMTAGEATWSEDQLLVLNRYGYAEECYFTFSYTPIWEEAGNVGGIFIAVNETTQKILSERRERTLRAETQAAKEAAERANQLKDQFLVVLSHELRSPLNPILGWAQLLLNRELDQPTTQRALEIIERNAKLQTQLIDDLLDVSRILRDKLVLNTAAIHLIPIIEDALETVQSTAASKEVRIQTQLNSAPWRILGDANRLKQVIWNLLSNAVKFTPNEGQILISLNYIDSFAQLQISDTGKGIAANFLPHVFDHFRQADTTTTRNFGGLGLGLAIAKQIVDLHGGTIAAASPGEGQGATFTVRLPLIATLLEPVLPDKSAIAGNCLENLQVLVVEDDADSLELTTFALQQYGATVIAVSSSAEAIAAFWQWQPDILVSDIGMPDIDGYMLMQQIRTMAPARPVLAIALTAYANESDQQQAWAAGFQKHLPKPLEPNQLIEAILDLVS